MLSSNTKARLTAGVASPVAAAEIESLLTGIPIKGTAYFVDPFTGSDTYFDGKSWDSPFATLSKALATVSTGGRIYIRGNIREEGLICSNLVFDVEVIGVGSQHHPDQPSSLYDPGSASIRPPASPTAATPLINVRGRGWKFINIMFDCPVDSAAIILRRNASSGTSEYDASHTQIINCRFTDGKYGIQNDGGASFVKVTGCQFQRISESGGAGIICTSTSVAVPLNWVIEDNHFHHNASHILSSMSYSTIQRNIFGRFTATLSVDIDDQPSANQGEYNVITMNYLSGTYGATAYPPGSNNEWGGNFNSLSGGVTAADPT